MFLYIYIMALHVLHTQHIDCMHGYAEPYICIASSPGLLRLSGVVCHVHPVDPRGIARVCVAHLLVTHYVT